MKRRRQTERAAFVTESLRSSRQRGEERLQNTARSENEYVEGLASGYRGIHRCQAERREKGVGADRARLRRQLQRRRLRLGHVSKRKTEAARGRRIHGTAGGKRRKVDPPP